MLPSVEGAISFRFFHRNLMEGWREMGGDGERVAGGTGKGVKGGRVREGRREGVTRKRWRREEGGDKKRQFVPIHAPLLAFPSYMIFNQLHYTTAKYMHLYTLEHLSKNTLISGHMTFNQSEC